MSYQVLARKWRPQTFSELVGQQHVVDAISNALENDKLHHAYLFTGTRGVGKTTIARIFSKSLNCETGQSANPCGTCDTCLDISEGRFVDLLEIDAASRTKVEDTRELLDNVQYKPTRGTYKVYLIDEVHMLSKHSFNALLKTLEEPPPHVKFLLATTDPQKLPVTILSRCLQFSLKALSREQIQTQLATILETEEIAFEQSALSQIARAASGSMRDALSLTDQAIAQGNNQISVNVVVKMLGLLDKNQILRLAKCICERDAQGAMAQLTEICADSPDYSQVLQQLMALLHQMALTQIVPDICKLDTNIAKPVYTLSKAVSAEHIQLLYQIALVGQRDLPYAPDAFTGLQMCIMRMLAFTPTQTIALETEHLKPQVHEPSSLLSGDNTSAPEDISQDQQSLESENFHMDPEGLNTKINDIKANDALVNDAEHSSTSASADPKLDDHKSTLTNIAPDEVDQQVADSSYDKIDNELSGIDSDQTHQEFSGVLQEGTDQKSADPEATIDNISQLQSLIDMEQDIASYEQEALSGDPEKKSELVSEAQHDAPASIASGPLHTNSEPQIESLSASNSSDLSDTTTPLDTGHSTQGLSIQHDSMQNETQPVDLMSEESDSAPDLNDREVQAGENITPYLSDRSKLTSAAQIDKWSAFVDALGVRGLARQLLIHGKSSGIKDQCLMLELDERHKHLSEESTLQSVKDALKTKFNRHIDVNVEYGEVTSSPYQIQQSIDKMRADFAKDVVNSDPSIQELVKAFDAEIIPESIQPR